MKTVLTSIELFAGVGGMAQGLHRAGIKTVAMCEWDRAAAGVLAHRFPHVPLFSDVSKYYPNESVDVLAGGSPCQDLSVAGKRKGLAGSRSGLFRQMVRIARRLRARYVLWENVAGALSSNKGRDFAVVVGSFTGCTPAVPVEGWGNAGFAPAAHPGRWNVAWRILDSQFFGVPQRRRRVFLVASLGDASCVEILLEPEGVCGDLAPRQEEGERVAPTLEQRAGRSGANNFATSGGLIGTLDRKSCSANRGCQANETDFLVAHTLTKRYDSSEDGTGRGIPLVPVVFNWQAAGTQTTLGASTKGTNCLNKSQTPAIAFPGERRGVRRLTPRECERLQGWLDDWTRWKREVKLLGNEWLVDDDGAIEQADGPRYKQCGNGVTANVAEWIGRRIVRFSTNTQRTHP